jgi:hypothetical protein
MMNFQIRNFINLFFLPLPPHQVTEYLEVDVSQGAKLLLNRLDNPYKCFDNGQY